MSYATSTEKRRQSRGSIQSLMNIYDNSPQQCISLSHSPSVQIYYSLRRKLEHCDEEWLKEFLELDGLESLLESLAQMTGKSFTSFSDSILQLDCIGCVRAILNTPIGLEYMVEGKGYTRKLIKALDTENTLCKKQLFEILSVICSHVGKGYDIIIDALEYYKKEVNLSYTFSVVVNELKNAETVPHKTVLVTFINCVINCAPDLHTRNRIRNNFIGLNLLDVLTFLQKEDSDEDLSLQLEVFYDRRHKDDEMLKLEYDLDFNSPEELLDEIQQKVFGSTRMVSLVNIMQDLLLVENNSLKRESTWLYIEKIVHHLVSSSDMDKSLDLQLSEILSVPSNTSHSFEHVPKVLANPLLNTPHICLCDGMEEEKHHDIENVENFMDMNAVNTCRESLKYLETDFCMPDGQKNCCQIPTRPLKTLYWIKIPKETLNLCPGNVWQDDLTFLHLMPDYVQLEKLFYDSPQRSGIHEVILLETKTRMNINLFLNRLEAEPNELIQKLVDGDPSQVTLPVLRYLHKVLPAHEEIVMLKNYKGNKKELGLPEQFLLKISEIPNYRVLLDGHLIRAEFTLSITRLKNSLRALTQSCKLILNNSDFKKFLLLVLSSGNYLNHGKYNGSVFGVTLPSLLRLMEVKSSLPKHSLLHQLVKQVMEHDKSTLQFISDLTVLEKAAGCSIEEMRSDMCKMNAQLKKFMQRLSTAHSHIKGIFQYFLEDIKKDFSSIQATIGELRTLTTKVSEYFCENESQFSLQTCFQHIADFYKQIKTCQLENTLFSKQHTQAEKRNTEIRRSIKNKHLTLEFGRKAGACSSVREGDNGALEAVLNELHQGNFEPATKQPPELTTPENEFNPLDLSKISPAHGSGRPFTTSSRDTLDDLFPPYTPEAHKNSENNLLSEPVSPITPAPPVLNIVKKVNFDIGVTSRDKPPPVSTAHKTHYRSRSDLVDAGGVANKWAVYEEQYVNRYEIMPEVMAPVAHPESSCVINTLHLEKQGRLLSPDDVMTLQDGPVVICNDGLDAIPEEPQEIHRSKKLSKRTSITNFFNRISRAVLRPKNINACNMPNNSSNNTAGLHKENSDLRRSRLKSTDKENIYKPSNMSIERRYAEREYKRFQKTKKTK